MTPKPTDTWIIAHLKTYWAVYMFIGQTIWMTGFFNFTIADHSKRIENLEQKQETEDIILSEIKTKLASIETSIKYIEQSISKI